MISRLRGPRSYAYSVWNACRVKDLLAFTVSNGVPGRQIVSYYGLLFQNVVFSPKFRGRPVRRLPPNAVLASTVPLKNMLNSKNIVFHKQSLKSRKYTVRPIRAAKKWPSLRRPKSNFQVKSLKLLSLFCRANAGSAIITSVASGPYTLHVKDCTGLE